tara:strand:+ start:32124 stop:33761 length:1638 start_codon:yes stop_codon:yes gene_type:complete
MSTNPLLNEKLSAYFDHEASPEARRELESLLENSAAARQELHEIGEISRLLQETATESAPPELASSIRRRIEQETLLAETAPSAVKRTPSLLRYRIAVAVSACSSIAALVLFVLLMNIPDPALQFAASDLRAPHSPSQPGAETTFMLHKNTPADSYTSSDSLKTGMQGEPVVTTPVPPVASYSAGSRRSDDLASNEALVANGSMTRKRKGDFSVRNTFAEKKVAENLPKIAMAVEPTASGLPGHIPVDTIRIGDVLPYFHDIEGKVAVIEVRVVDVKQALGTMELLLARNNIPVNQRKQSEVERQLQGTDSLKTKTADQKNRKAQQADDSETELFAVYVEATDAQLTSALQDFQTDLQRDQLLGLTLQPAIDASSLTDQVEELPRLLALQQLSRTEMEKIEAKAKDVSDMALNKESFGADATANGSTMKKIATVLSPALKAAPTPDKQRSYQTRYRMQMPAEQLEQRPNFLVQKDAAKQELDKTTVSSLDLPLIAAKPTSDQNANSTTGKALGLNESAATVTTFPVKVLFVFKGTPLSTTAPVPN